MSTMTPIGCAHAALNLILFACSATLLGLTAYHVHFTLTSGFVSFYVPIVVELLATSCFAVIVSFVFFIVILGRRGGRNIYGAEAVFLIIIAIMYLVGAAVLSRNWPNTLWCLGTSYVCHILNAIVAFSWINWAFTIIVVVICCFDMGSTGRSSTDPAHGQTDNHPMATVA